MRRYQMIVCLSLLVLAGWAGAASALSYDAAEPLDRNPARLIVQCGIPAEFDPVHTTAVLIPENQTRSASTSNEQNAAPVTAVPEPSTLLLVGLACIGVIGVARRKKSGVVPCTGHVDQ